MMGGGELLALLTVQEAREIKEAHLAFEGAGGDRRCDWFHEGFS